MMGRSIHRRRLVIAGTLVLLVAASAVGMAAGPDPRPADPRSLAAIGRSWLQDARESFDPASLARAEEAFVRLSEADPGDVEGVIGQGLVALARHDFARALDLGREAVTLAPGSARPLAVVVDALIELGRYEDAGDALQRMLLARPDLASYSRLSYFHELHGRTDRAIEAMEHAVIAGGPAVENTEFARVQLGDLWLRSGATDRAEGLYRVALTNLPGYVPALRGLARVAEIRGDLAGAIARYQEAADRVPLLDILVSLGEAQLAARRAEAAQGSFALVRDIGELLRANGVAVDLDLAAFEADHGGAGRAVEMARTAYRAAPSIRSADVLAWALFRAGRAAETQRYVIEALRTGTHDPTIRAHAGIIALSLGDRADARAWLTESLDGGLMASTLQARWATSALAEASPTR
jgi:tetratricopeptide (TPR) repeat protein